MLTLWFGAVVLGLSAAATSHNVQLCRGGCGARRALRATRGVNVNEGESGLCVGLSGGLIPGGEEAIANIGIFFNSIIDKLFIF